MIEARRLTERFGHIHYSGRDMPNLEIITTNHGGIYRADIEPLKRVLSGCRLVGLESDHTREGADGKKYYRFGWTTRLEGDVLYLNPLDYYVLHQIRERLANEAAERHQRACTGELVYWDEFQGLREIARELHVPYANVDVPITHAFFNALTKFETISDMIHSMLSGQSKERTEHMLAEMKKLAQANPDPGARYALVMGAGHLKDIKPRPAENS